MKKLEYLSPSGISLWLQDKTKFYFRYLCEHFVRSDVQTEPMAVGSAFDAYCKSWLHEKLFGIGNDERFLIDNIFEAQVQPARRDKAKIDGKRVFDFYVEVGGLADLLLMLQKAVGPPRFEIEMSGVVGGEKQGLTLRTDKVTLLGKPDVFFINEHGQHVILDWKVNGFYGKNQTTPMQGYVRCKSLVNKHGDRHPRSTHMIVNGMEICLTFNLDTLNEDWARQLGIYGWLCGEQIGNPFITAIDQLCGPGHLMRLAQHRLRVGTDFQWKTFQLACDIWAICESGYIFRELTIDENEAKIELLDEMAKKGTIREDDWMNDTRREFKAKYRS